MPTVTSQQRPCPHGQACAWSVGLDGWFWLWHGMHRNAWGFWHSVGVLRGFRRGPVGAGCCVRLMGALLGGGARCCRGGCLREDIFFFLWCSRAAARMACAAGKGCVCQQREYARLCPASRFFPQLPVGCGTFRLPPLLSCHKRFCTFRICSQCFSLVLLFFTCVLTFSHVAGASQQ